MLRWKGVEVSSGALLLWTALYYFDEQGLLPLCLLACIVHELGHYLAILALGGQVTVLRITCVGAEMCLSSRRKLGWLEQILAALAGPLVNLAAGFAAVRLWGPAGWCFGGINFALAAFNLLPAGRLDGGRAVWFLLSPALGREGADHILRILAGALAAGLLLGALLLLRAGRWNLTLWLLALWLLTESVWGGKKDLQSRQRYGKILRTQ